VSTLRGEIGEVVTTWILWRMYRIQELRQQTSDLDADTRDLGLRLLGIVIARLRDDITARLSELGEEKLHRVNFHVLALKEPRFQSVAAEFTQFVRRGGIRDRRQRDISHKELPESWNDRKYRYVYDRTITRGTALAVRIMKRIDNALLGPESIELWRVMRQRRYEPTSPPSVGYRLMPLIMLPIEARERLASRASDAETDFA
jgi:hypothetical protein